MAENETQPQIDQPGTPSPAPTPEVAPSGETTPSINLDSKVAFDGKEVTVGELIADNQRVTDLEAYRQQASVLMQGENAPLEVRENAMKYLLAQEGYTRDQIEDYVSASREVTMQSQEGESTPNPTPAPQPQVDPQAEYRMREMEQRQSQMGIDILKKDLGAAVSHAMTSNDKIKMLVEKSRELGGAEGLDDRIKSIEGEVQRTTMDLLRSRKNRGERFDKSWFDQETNRAADAVYERIRSVIGDPDKIQRSPETASDTDNFINRPPVADPHFEKGDNMGTATDKSHDYTVDTLARLALDISSGGESKI